MSAWKFENDTLVPDVQVSRRPSVDVRQRPASDHARRTKRARILVCDPIPAMAVERMRAAGLGVDECAGISPEALTAMIGDYDAVVVRSATKLGARQIEAARKLRMIVRAGVGTDNIDLAAATLRQIVVLNTPQAPSVSVAELALGLLLALARRIPQADAAVKAGMWPKQEFADGIELAGRTLGIVGVGRIGGALGRRAAALGMAVVGTDTTRAPAGRFDGLELVSLAALLPRADFVSIHVPPSADGCAVIGAAEIARMKDGVLLINCARGGVVDEAALLAALDSGKVGGAALDVFAEEPPRNLRLARHPQVVCTPHLGASTREAQVRTGMEVAELLLKRL